MPDVADACELAAAISPTEWPEWLFDAGIFNEAHFSRSYMPCLSFVLEVLELSPSKGQARHLIEQGGVRVNGKVERLDRALTADDLLYDSWVVISKGKHGHNLVRVF